MPEPHLVGRQDQHRPGHWPLAKPPEPLGEAGPVGGESLPDDAQGPAAGQNQAGVQGHGPVPAEAYWESDTGDGAGQPVDGGQGVHALHQAAPPLGRDEILAHQLFNGHAFLFRETAQPGGGEVEPPGRGQGVGSVKRRSAEPAGFQLLHRPIDRAPGPARHLHHLQAVEEGHLGQGAQQLGLTSVGSHSSASSPAASNPMASSLWSSASSSSSS